MRTLFTIGTDDVWAPPRMCGFELVMTDDEVQITNANRVWWDIYIEGFVTRWAMRFPQGWVVLPLPEPVKVGPMDTPAILAAHALVVSVDPPGELLGRELPTAARFPELGS
jgi:hypothetical protein